MHIRKHWLLGLLIAMYAMSSCIAIGWAWIHRSQLTAVATLLTTLIVAAGCAALTRHWRPFFLWFNLAYQKMHPQTAAVVRIAGGAHVPALWANQPR